MKKTSAVFALPLFALPLLLLLLFLCRPALMLPRAGADEAIREPRFSLSQDSARPGETVTIACDDSPRTRLTGLRAVLLNAGGKRLSKSAFFTLPAEEGEEELKAAILPVPSTAAPGNLSIRIESADSIIREIPFIVTSRNFLSETIPLNQSNTDLRTVPDPKKTIESEQLWAILSRTGTVIYSGSAFLPPVTSTRRTSNYGDRRVYLYTGGEKDTSIHAGVDYGVPTGTEVKACAGGKVVLAQNRIVTGNSVVIEHLPGVYSLYYHLDSIKAGEGASVEAGSLIGLSGSTGLATGPHLHWEIRVSGENADPDAFMSRPVLDKNDILNKIRNYPLN